MTMYSIYALCEPGSFDVRYVGKTKQAVKERLYEHIATAKASRRNHLYEWINRLGKYPDTVLLATCPSDIVRDVERAWIILFIDNGYDMLNVRDCDGRGKKAKHNPSRCDDPAYFSNVIDGMIAEEEQGRWLEAFGPSALKVLNGDSEAGK